LNFTQSATELNIVQPALSRKIKQLEEEMNVLLFKRNKRNVALTTAGTYFIKEVEQLVGQMDRIIKRTGEIHRGEAGEIKIGFTHSVMQSILPDILKNIHEKIPGMKTILREMNNRDQYLALQSGTLDVGFATNPLVPPFLKSKVFHIDNFVVLLPKDHPVSKNNYTDFSVFSEEAFIFPSLSDGPNYVRIVESICLEAGFKPTVVHETDSASTSFRLVEAGLGISIEPTSSIREQDLTVKIIELTEIPQKAELTMLWSAKLELEYPQLFELLSK
jgi:DNA-binding transcriptional LysR family regulator